MDIYLVTFAGGGGERFSRPLSLKGRPKQFLQLLRERYMGT